MPIILKAPAFTKLSVAGYKSIYEEQKIRVAPLTILAGANSSGKSSFMQPFMLMKQTLDSPYDAGVFLLYGENVKITDRNQIFSNIGTKKSSELLIKIEIDQSFNFASRYENSDTGLILMKQEFGDKNSTNSILQLTSGMSASEINKMLKIGDFIPNGLDLRIERERCFLSIAFSFSNNFELLESKKFVNQSASAMTTKYMVKSSIENIVHLSGLRGNPERAYPKYAVSDVFPGRFEVYTASIIHHWQTNKETEKILESEKYLQLLGLTSKVRANQIDDTKLEILVGRLPKAKKGKSKDWVNIADVGFGVSQTLPILVALVQAKQGQTVYIEQPETHLHPKAQYQLAQLFVTAAKRGVVLIIETHSAILLRGIQTLIAKGELSHEDVALHWFSRDKDGATRIDTADLDENGAFGDWPEDFDDTLLHVESEYLNAAESRG